MNSNMAEVKFNRGTYSKSIVDSLKDGELFFDANTDTTSAAGNQGIYMGVAQADGTIKPVKVAMGVKQYMDILDRAFIRGRTMTDNIYMFTDDTATGLRYAPSIFTGRTGFNLIVGKKGTGSGPFDGRNYSAASMWAGESFGGKLTLNGWTKGIDDLKAGNSFDLSSFFVPNGFDVSVFREGSTTAMDAVVGVFHCKGTYGISHKNGTINDVTGLFIDPNKTTNARVGVVILGKTDDDLLTANGSTVSASGFAKTTDIPSVNDSKITIKMNGAEKGSFTLNQAAASEVDLGTVITSHQDISGKVDKTALLNTLAVVDLSSSDIAVRKAALDDFKTKWLALGNTDLNGARFIGGFTDANGNTSIHESGKALVGEDTLLIYRQASPGFPQGFYGLSYIKNMANTLCGLYQIYVDYDTTDNPGNVEITQIRDSETLDLLNRFVYGEAPSTYLKITDAEETYLKKAAGEVKTANLADKAVTENKLNDDLRSKVNDNVKTVEQTLTAEQKARARKNIDVDYLTEDEVANLWDTTK